MGEKDRKVWKERSKISKIFKQEPVRTRNHAIVKEKPAPFGEDKTRKSQIVKAKKCAPLSART